MDWILFLSQLPTNPSSLRVTVWRKMRANGALGLQNGVWMLPDRSEQIHFLQDLSEIILTCPPKTDPGYKLGKAWKRNYTLGKAGEKWARKSIQLNKSSAS